MQLLACEAEKSLIWSFIIVRGDLGWLGLVTSVLKVLLWPDRALKLRLEFCLL